MNLDEWKKLLSSAEDADRSEAADILPDGDVTPEVIGLLLKALHDKNALVRTCAADTLGSCDSEVVRVALRDALNHETDELARGYILSSLGHIGELSDFKILVDEALKKNPTEFVKLHVATGVISLALNRAIGMITAICESHEWKIRASAFAHLKNFVEELALGIDSAVEVAESRKDKEESMLESEHIEKILRIGKRQSPDTSRSS